MNWQGKSNPEGTSGEIERTALGRLDAEGGKRFLINLLFRENHQGEKGF